MTTLALLSDLAAVGVTLQPQGDKLRFHPRDRVTPELLDRITEHKPELLRVLAEPEPFGDLQPRDDHADDRRDIGPQAPPQRRQPRPAEPSEDWPAALADFVLLLQPEDLPAAPFSPGPAATVTDHAKYLRTLQADIRRGPSGPRARYGALQDDLRRLQRTLAS